jgi:hypothetical protein
VDSRKIEVILEFPRSGARSTEHATTPRAPATRTRNGRHCAPDRGPAIAREDEFCSYLDSRGKTARPAIFLEISTVYAYLGPDCGHLIQN